jgi:tRNA pseudouridine55 synthase
MFSAIKQKGKPLYKLARAGIVVDRIPRNIFIHTIQVLNWQSPFLTLSIYCSKGTYVRTLVDDIGEALGCGAYVVALRRTKMDGLPLTLSSGRAAMVSFKELEEISQSGRKDAMTSLLLPIRGILSSYMPVIDLTVDQTRAIQYGQLVYLDVKAISLSALTETVCLNNPQGQFIGIGQIDTTGTLRAKRLCIWKG